LAGDAAMMGVQAAAARLFYDFCLDDHVPTDHQLRGIDRQLPVRRPHMAPAAAI
jgi:hypothetical protein